MSLEGFGFSVSRPCSAASASSSAHSLVSSAAFSGSASANSSVSSSSSSSTSSSSCSYPPIAPFTSASNIDYVDPSSVHGWHSDVWKLRIFAVSKQQVESDSNSEKKAAKTKTKFKVFCTLCSEKGQVWEKLYNGTTNLSSHLKSSHPNNARVQEMLKSAELLAAQRWEERAAANNALIQVCAILFLLHRCV